MSAEERFCPSCGRPLEEKAQAKGKGVLGQILHAVEVATRPKAKA